MIKGVASAGGIALALVLAAPWAEARAPARIVYLEPARAMQAQRDVASGRERIAFEAYGKRFELQLEPNARLRGAVPTGRGDLVALEGRIIGLPDSWARITRTRQGLSGLVSDGRELYAVEPAPQVAAFADPALTPPDSGTVVYRLADTLIDEGAVSCGVAAAGEPVSALALYEAVGAELTALAAVAVDKQLDVAMIADYELFQAYGSSTADFLVARMNIVDGIYAAQAGLRVRVGSTRIHDTPQDQFTTTVADDLLRQVADARRLTPVSQRLALTHLMTGRELDDTTVGIAYLDAICSGSSASLTEAKFGKLSATLISLVAAHEIGHNFGAPHDGEAGKACATTPTTFLMAPSLSTQNSQFSQCSLTQISQRIANAACLGNVDQADVAIVAPVATVRHGLEENYSLTFTVRSIGTRTADLVSAAFTVPPASTLDAINAAGGTCTSIGSQASCSLGSLAPGTSRTVTLSLTGRALGTETLNARVFAANDAAPGNNSMTVEVVTDPIADLGVTLIATPANLVVGDDTTLTVTMNNAGPAAAADARLSIDVPAGITIGSFGADGLSCLASANSISCSPVALAVGEARSVTVTAHAATAGTRTVSALALSSAIDPVSGNNSASAVLTISAGGGGGGPPNPPPPSSGASGGGGGGSLSLPLLAALALALGVSRRRPAGPSRRPACRASPVLRRPDRPVRPARPFPFSSPRA